jgi:hypothetical protein
MHFLQGRGFVGSTFGSPNHAGWTSKAEPWVWSPLTTSEVLGDPGGEQPVMLGTPCMILSVGFE